MSRFLGNFWTDRRGSAATQVALSLFVLLGFAGLAIDLGRTFTLNSELQQAADAAALAAAAELDGFAGAQSRATAAATAFGPNRQTFATDALGNGISIASITFLSDLGSPGTLLPPTITGAGDVPASGDADSYYVQVVVTARTITGALASLVTSNNVFTTTAAATAGRALTSCMDVALMICNPVEPNDPFAVGALRTGYQVNVSVAGGFPPGNGGFLCPPNNSNCGGTLLGEYLASAALGGAQVLAQCTVNNPTGGLPTKTGNTSGQAAKIDTRMGSNSNSTYPPSVNITTYPRDTSFSSRGIGNGTWNPNSAGGYWPTNHPGVSFPPSGMVSSGPAGPSRYDVYNWENNTGNIPKKPSSSPAGTSADRRLMNVAIVNCNDENVHGRSTIIASGYFTGFITEPFSTSKQVFLEVVKKLSSGGSASTFHTNVRLVR